MVCTLTKNAETMLKVGIVGGAGYTAGELIRILLHHPGAELAFVQSSSSAGKALPEVHEGIFGDTELRFCEGFDLDAADVLFLCGGHGASRSFWEKHERPARLKVIDLAQDYRVGSDGYVYGLPELNGGAISQAYKVANPGCFATAIQLALLPLASAGLLRDDICVTAITGSTGAGVKPGPATHFSWRSGNISAYKVYSHQHETEILRTLGRLQGGAEPKLNFIPLRGDFTRGIFAAVQTRCPLAGEQVRKLYESWYRDKPFTFLSPVPVDLKQVCGTNKCLISLEMHEDRLVIFSVIDNLLKGASGQAVQNMNLMFGLPETAGLQLKATAF